MAISKRILLKGTIWTVGAYLAGNALRLATSIVLARLLSPEIFGIMTIIYTMRNGIDLLSDIGVSQNIIQSKNAEDPDFYNTAWTLQLIRNLVVFAIFLTGTIPAARFYNSELILYIMPVIAFSFVTQGLSSVGPHILRKRLEFGKITAFELGLNFTQAASAILAALVTPTVWSLVFSYVLNGIIGCFGSYLLVPGVRQRVFISRRYATEIAHFGKWVFISSLAFFLAMNFDRLYLAKIIPLEVVGVYSIARSMADLVSSLFLRLGSSLIFPLIAAHAHEPRHELRNQLRLIRKRFLFLAALGFAAAAGGADLAIRLLYDQRYSDATWMLPILILGGWFSILANLNESTLLGLGKPSYAAISNAFKCLTLMIGLPLGFSFFGLLGAVCVIGFADLSRYIPVLVGQVKERFSFARQDFFLSLLAFSTLALIEWLRHALGFGTSFQKLPI